MRRITRKGEIANALSSCKNALDQGGLTACVHALAENILAHKVKFPLLEFCGIGLYDLLPEQDHIAFCDQLAQLHTMGGNVILGIILQKRLGSNFSQSFEKARAYISLGEQWYVCDIIGERVFGYALLTEPEKALPLFRKLSKDPSKWVVRSLGAGGHYAIKKGLEEMQVRKVFELLLQMCNTKDKEVRQGVGWAAKTTAKFHPHIIELYIKEVENTTAVPNWFRSKIKIGLARHQHAQRN